MPRTKLFRVFLAASLLPLVAWADDTPQVITVTATRIATPEQKVPAGVTVITKADFKKRGYITLAQALSAVPGLGVVHPVDRVHRPACSSGGRIPRMCWCCSMACR